MALSLLNDSIIRNALGSGDIRDVLEPRILILGDCYKASHILADPESKERELLSNGVIDVFVSTLRLRSGITKAEVWSLNCSVEAERHGNGVGEKDVNTLVQALKEVPGSGPIIVLIIADFCDLSGLSGALRLAQSDELKGLKKILYVFHTTGTLPSQGERPVRRSGVEGTLELVALNIGATIVPSATEFPENVADRNAWREELRKVVANVVEPRDDGQPPQLLGMKGLELNTASAARLLQEVGVTVVDASNQSVALCISSFIIPVFGDSRAPKALDISPPCPCPGATLIGAYKLELESKDKKTIPKGMRDVLQRSLASSPHSQSTPQAQQQLQPPQQRPRPPMEPTKLGLLAGVAKLEGAK